MRASAILCAIIVLTSAAIARGQPAQATPPGGPSKINADRLRWMQYKMVAGRIAVSSSYPGTNMTFGPAHVDGRRRERLEIHINQAQIDLQYELVSPDERLAIALVDGKDFSIRRSRPHSKYTFEFRQSPEQPIVMSLEDADARCVLQADSFWHLYLAEPELVRRHLVPLLEILHPSWQLASMGAAVEEALVERAQHSRPLDVGRWSRLVNDLASPKFADRTGAERELRSAGQAILPFLQNLDRARLDAEQASRVRALVESLSNGYEDSTDRIASWLAGDPQVWLSLLTRGEAIKRRVSAEQLTALVGAPIEFDPTADEAVRKTQIENLRARLQKPAPPEQADGPGQ